jgi:hypothetical protein
VFSKINEEKSMKFNWQKVMLSTVITAGCMTIGLTVRAYASPMVIAQRSPTPTQRIADQASDLLTPPSEVKPLLTALSKNGDFTKRFVAVVGSRNTDDIIKLIHEQGLKVSSVEIAENNTSQRRAIDIHWTDKKGRHHHIHIEL